MRKALIAAAAVAVTLAIVALAAATPAARQGATAPTTYVVVYETDASKAAARKAIRASGARLVRENAKIGVATVVSRNPRFIMDAAKTAALYGAARNRPLGRVRPELRPKVDVDLRALRRLQRLSRTKSRSGLRLSSHNSAEPLAGHQWDMRMIHATPNGSYKKERGDKKVLVGILDTGIDGNHPDIKANFSRSLSRNFTTDIPLVDGPCEVPSCVDPNDVDENSHGTHVASTVASPINGLGVAGVAPNVTLVNLRAGQDSGFFFLQPSVDALVRAGDIGIDVANMSYFIDPWLYNCGNPLHPIPEDSSGEKAEQAAIIEATQRALDYAHVRGVTLIAAAGNGNHDIIIPAFDGQSPNFPPGIEHDRTVNNTCLNLPTEGNNVISISSVGPSKTKADYSNWGYGEIGVAAPGGWFRDAGWPDTALAIENLILAAYPENVAREFGEINPDGTPNTPFVLRDCKGSKCAYYQWIQGTSMASPHAVGVAALIVSRHGSKRGGGISLHPLFTQAYLEATATDTACMSNQPDGTFSYAFVNRSPAFTAYCQGTPVYNGVYGHGIVDALSAVTFGGHDDDDD